MDKAWLGIVGLLPLVFACGPKVEGPFEGEGRYEGQYQEGTTPEGWRVDRGTVDDAGRPDTIEEEVEVAEVEIPVYTNFNQALAGLRNRVDEFRSSDDPRDPELVAALRDLASAIELAPGADVGRARAQQIRNFADRIADTDTTSVQHAGWTKSALEHGMRAVNAIARDQDRTVYGFEVLETRIDNLADDVPLADQRDAYADVLQELTVQLRELGQEGPRGTE